MVALTVCFLLVVAVPGENAQDSCRLATDAMSRGDSAAAESLLRECIKVQPGIITPYIQLCALYQSRGREIDLYRTALDGLGKFPGEKRFYLTVALHDTRNRRYESAIKVLAEGLRRWPGDSRLRDSLGVAYLEMGLGQLDAGKDLEAEKSLRKATQMNPDDVEARLNLGRALHNLRRSREAIAEFDRVLQLKPDLPLAHFHRGMVLCNLGEFKPAIVDLDKEIQMNPGYPPSYLFRGVARMGLEEWPGALPDLETAVLRMPDNFKAHYSLGRCLSRLGRTADAEAEYRKAMELDPSDASTVMALARLLQQAGKSAEAGVLFKRAGELMDLHRVPAK
ncbi:MAG TPA: tetratricopeptide repeat protein [Acidobacteriota bacterium]|nr:tetratricopeptide repeat protein [Acidobacteriota bacterium]